MSPIYCHPETGKWVERDSMPEPDAVASPAVEERSPLRRLWLACEAALDAEDERDPLSYRAAGIVTLRKLLSSGCRADLLAYLDEEVEAS